MVSDEIAWAVFQALDNSKGKDLITSSHEIRTKFNLSEEEFNTILREWEEE